MHRPVGTASAQPRVAFAADEIAAAVARIRQPVTIVRDPATSARGLALDGASGFEVLASLPPMYPEWLGDRAFLEAHGVRFPYVTGSMANGIATPRLVVAMARAGMLGFYGAAGLSPDRVAAGLDAIERGLDGLDAAWGANLIHSPQEPGIEARVAELYLQRGVRRVEASAYLQLTAPIVRYACTGLHVDTSGRIARRHHVIAKISRPEVAAQFMAPAPQRFLDDLLERGELTAEEARLATHVPLAEDITVEADSGGHTDNRPLGALFPVIQDLRDRIEARHGYPGTIRLGAAGGLGTPASVASAFSLGAAYVLTGSVNQGAVESGLSQEGREMLAGADIADVAMAAAADMFEMGVKLQVLKRGTLFAPRSRRLYEVYSAHGGLHELSDATRAEVEKLLGASIDEVWAETEQFWQGRDPAQIERAERDPKHKMALVFRWYLGLSSRWAITGQSDRRVDYQVWCGPAMGAFNSWVEGSFLEAPERREAVQIARNLLEGAAVHTRAQQLRTFGLPVPSSALRFTPRVLR